MEKNRRKFLKILLTATGVLAVGKIFGFSKIPQAGAASWNEPSSPPPGGNVATPLNVGITPQTKQGDLTIQGSLKANSRLKIPVGTDLFD